MHINNLSSGLGILYKGIKLLLLRLRLFYPKDRHQPATQRSTTTIKLFNDN